MEEIEKYIHQFPSSVQELLLKIREIINDNAPDAEEHFAYGMPAYKLHKKPLVYFAAFKNHPQWNPFIKSIQGDQKVGSKITVSIKPPKGNGMTFKPEILVLNKNNELRWKGKLLFKGIFDGEHIFKMESLDEQKTKFIHGEKFSGILVSMMGKALDNTKIGFQLMNEALKKECERNPI